MLFAQKGDGDTSFHISGQGHENGVIAPFSPTVCHRVEDKLGRVHS